MAAKPVDLNYSTLVRLADHASKLLGEFVALDPADRHEMTELLAELEHVIAEFRRLRPPRRFERERRRCAWSEYAQSAEWKSQKTANRSRRPEPFTTSIATNGKLEYRGESKWIPKKIMFWMPLLRAPSLMGFGGVWRRRKR